MTGSRAPKHATGGSSPLQLPARRHPRWLRAQAASPLAWIAGGLALLCFLQAQAVARGSLGPDFYHYWLVPRVLASAGSDVYRSAPRRRIATDQLQEARRQQPSSKREQAAVWNAREYEDGIQPTGTPFFYAFFELIVSGDYERSYDRYQLLANLSSVAALIGLGLLLGFAPATAAMLPVLFTIWFDPFVADVRFANSNRLLLAFVVVYLALLRRSDDRRSSLAAGAALGMIVLFKPTVIAVPALLSTLWMIQGRYQRCFAHAIAMGVALLVGVAGSSVLFGGWDCWPAWLESLRQFGQGSRPDAPMLNNVSTARILLELSGRDFSGVLSGLLFIGAAVWLWRYRTPASGNAGFRTEAWTTGIACVFPLIAAPIAWTHYFVLAIPLLVLLLSKAPDAEPSAALMIQWGIATLAIGVLAGSPLRAITGVESRLAVAGWQSGALFLSLGLALFRYRAEARAPALT